MHKLENSDASCAEARFFRSGVGVCLLSARRRRVPARLAAVLRGAACLCLLGSLLRADDLTVLRERVREIIGLQKAAHEAQVRWDKQKADLRRTREVLGKQVQEYQKQLATLSRKAKTDQTEHDALAAKVKAARAAIRSLSASVESGEDALRRLIPYLPPCLMKPLAPTFAELPKKGAPATPEVLADRLRRVFSLFSEIENFDNGVHVCRQVLTDPGGAQREMDVLYVGLGAAYAVSTGGQVAGVGVPGPGGPSGKAGWHWTWNAALAKPIRQAVAIYRKEQPAGFVSLPVAIVGDRKP